MSILYRPETALPGPPIVHNPDKLPGAADSDDDPLEQDAPDHPADDPAILAWFLAEGDRANRATDLRGFTTGNLVQPLVDGREYFARLCAEISAAGTGDQIYFLDFRGDMDERLDGPDTAASDVLGAAARRGAAVFGLLWRTQPKVARQHAGLAGVAHDGHRRAEVPDLPVRVARLGVLTHLVVAGGLVRGGVRARSGAGRRIG